MNIARLRFLAALVAFLALLPFLVSAGTISVGEVRVVQGRISAVDVAYRSVVVEAPAAEGDFTVGVTLAESVMPRGPDGPMALESIQIGKRAVLKYTREDGRLVGLDLRIVQ